MYVVAEVCVISGLYGLAYVAQRDGEAMVGFEAVWLKFFAQQLTVALVGRGSVLLFKPQWLGRVVLQDDARKWK